MMNVPLVIFDMDGVLIDVSRSYREVSRLTIIRYLQQVIGVKELVDDFITLQDIAAIKRTGGLNNDWDLSYAIIDAVLKMAFDDINQAIAGEIRKVAGLGDDHAVLAMARPLLMQCDTRGIAQVLSHQSVREIFFECSRRSNSFLQTAPVSPFLLNSGDVKTGNIVKRIFQEIYLGKELFEKLYGEKPIFFKKRGYIEKERLIPTLRDIEALGAANTLSIATGRPEVEARYALESFAINNLFAVVISEDDIVREELKTGDKLRKPHPFGIDLCIKKSGYVKMQNTVYYIGDMPDDMVASKRAGVVPVGFVNDNESAEEKDYHSKLLVDRGAIAVFNNYRELVSFFAG